MGSFELMSQNQLKSVGVTLCKLSTPQLGLGISTLRTPMKIMLLWSLSRRSQLTLLAWLIFWNILFCAVVSAISARPILYDVEGLNTYMNAFTAGDTTAYPFATRNKDFYNLLSVYLDAVFFPNLIAWILLKKGGELKIKKIKTVADYLIMGLSTMR